MNYKVGLYISLLLLASKNTLSAQISDKPNILFILSDDHTSQTWGVYGGLLSGYAQNTNIKQLASEGCVLENCFCTNSISVPSRASIMTGAYSHKNGVYTLADALDPSYDNVAKRIKQEGYQTAIIGKWHLKNKPSGFDHFEVFHDQGVYINPIFKTKNNWEKGDTVKGFSTDIVTNKTINWIKQRNIEKPFMICCHFKATHEPYDFPKRNKDLFKNIIFPEPENMQIFTSNESERTFRGLWLEDLAKCWETATETGKWWCQYPELPFKRKHINKEADRSQIYQKLVRDYLRCAATIDQNIGKLLNFLKEEGLEENTIVIYVSDQGYFLGEHGFYDKRLMYETSLRMPFIIRYPKEIPPGTRNKDIILNIDFASLLCDYAGAPSPLLSQGRSFRENLKGYTPSDWRTSMYYRYWTNDKYWPAHFGLRNERYKLIFFYGRKLHMKGSSDSDHVPSWEFYDLLLDPKENKNEYNNPIYKVVINKMKQDLIEKRSLYDDIDYNNKEMNQILNQYYW
ncbi:sulfatase [Phocaeicola coprocola]|uniref:sulfatase family protein n=1 Tax=Phocaeicola coprocola TaxID=310298 RepID=UPI0024203B7B|nr:sulfatase [Phocaeicola coprocola]